jgi:hypothetical protein
MSVSIEEQPRWFTRCSECSAAETFSSETAALNYKLDHELEHERYRQVGRSIQGRVFDTDAKGNARIGIIHKAIEAAQEAGYPYLTWNGNVYETIGLDFNRRVCRAEDVPGTTAALRFASR